MKKDKIHSVKKLWITVWVIVMSVMIVGIVSGAAYINRNSVKRVVSTQGGGGTAFSSNYMTLSASDAYSIKNISFPENENTMSFDITVCNYVQNDPSKVNDKDIEYTLTLTLLDNNNQVITSAYTGLSVTDGAFTDGVCTITGQTLAGKTKSVNKYTVTVPKAFVDEGVRIKAVAEPTESSKGAVNNSTLGRIFAFSYAIDSAMTWTGSFVETTVDGYDGFNYVIKGQGKGTVTLTWDPANLEISKVFLELNNFTAANSSLTFAVDSNNINRFDIQFYKVEGGVYDTIDAVKSYVEFTFAESGNQE